MLENEAVETIATCIAQVFKEQRNSLSFDKSIEAKIVSLIAGNKYKVSSAGKEYNVTSLNSVSYSSGQTVMITFMDNVLEKGVIMGRL